jgi:hypothetical protein
MNQREPRRKRRRRPVREIRIDPEILARVLVAIAEEITRDRGGT